MAFWVSLGVVHLVIAILASGHALLHRPTARSSLVWIGSLAMLPGLGVLLYLVFGIDRIRRRALIKGYTRDELRKRYPHLPSLARAENDYAIADDAPLSQLHRIIGRLSGRPLLDDNGFRLLRNGEETYRAMLEAIDGAQVSINMMTYIFDEDPVGQRFIDALCEATGRGVKVRLLYDAAGCVKTSRAFFQAARDRGVRMEPFFPLNPLVRRAQINLRNHRKVLVVDGRTGFIGGVNISQNQLADDTDNPNRCQDLHLRVEGPVVQQLQEVFAEDWYYAVDEALLTENHFPALSKAGDAIARVVTSGPDQEYDYVHHILFAAFGLARRRIQIATPYFLPEEALHFALTSAVLRGVQAEVFVPSVTDHPVIRRATFAKLLPLVTAGVRVYDQPPPFVHAKAYLIDGEWALMGSANMDPRSLRLNYEVMAEMSKTAVLAELSAWFDEARARSTRITREALLQRPLRTRMVDNFWRLFTPLL